jgi:hypothetical protein
MSARAAEREEALIAQYRDRQDAAYAELQRLGPAWGNAPRRSDDRVVRMIAGTGTLSTRMLERLYAEQDRAQRQQFQGRAAA